MLAIITLTTGGKKTADLIKKNYKDVCIYSKPFERPFKEIVKSAFGNHDRILFIMATGIVVRSIATLLDHKSNDPAILVMDEKGRFVISLVSGHLGGANKLAKEISYVLPDCQPVITTASDVNDLLSVDMLAKKYNLTLNDYVGAKNVTAKLVDGFNVYVMSELKIDEQGYKETLGGDISAVLEVSNKSECFDTTLPYVKLISKNLVLGIGCKKDTKPSDLTAFVDFFLKENGYLKEAVSTVSSAWIKHDEKAIVKLKEALNIEYITYEKDKIKEVEELFESSDFVRQVLGVGAVSEPCGYLASKKGKKLVGIKRHNGMTLSLWETKGK